MVNALQEVRELERRLTSCMVDANHRQWDVPPDRVGIHLEVMLVRSFEKVWHAHQADADVLIGKVDRAVRSVV